MSGELFEMEPESRAGWTVVAAHRRAELRGPIVPAAPSQRPFMDLPFDSPLPPPTSRRCDVCNGVRLTGHDLPWDGETQTYVMRRQRWVKIGRSKHPETRLKELRAVRRACYIITPPAMNLDAKISLVAVIDGDVEHELHERFLACHAGGEWFRIDPAMRSWLGRL